MPFRYQQPAGFRIPLRCAALAAITSALILCAGCSGIQSAMSPAGRDAERIMRLFVWMSAAFIAVWAAMVVFALSVRRLDGLSSHRGGTLLIIGGGVVFPITVLTLLLVLGLRDLPRILAPGPEGEMSIDIVASQWWWRIRYVPADGSDPVELANELRLPLGRRVNTRLIATDVIHSFWIPSLAGKMDMIPGRVNRLALEPTRAGTFRGACAEYCGTSHARMNLLAVVMEHQAFDAWFEAERRPAARPGGPVAERGRSAFFTHGCNTCHTVRGTTALGVVGPDLTHVGSRLSLAAGTLPNTPADMRRWVAHTQRLKPAARMPAFDNLSDETLAALAAYLDHLK